MKLAARGVTRRFGGLTALEDVSLELAPGEVHGLIGPNGSGKTTLLNLFSGYYLADAGTVELEGEDLTRAPVQRRAFAGIARTFQKPRLLPALTVLENAMLGGWPHVSAGFLSSALALPAARRQDAQVRRHAEELLHGHQPGITAELLGGAGVPDVDPGIDDGHGAPRGGDAGADARPRGRRSGVAAVGAGGAPGAAVPGARGYSRLMRLPGWTITLAACILAALGRDEGSPNIKRRCNAP